MIRKDYGLFYIQETLQRTEGFVTQIYGSSTRQENVAIRCRIYSHSIIYGMHNQLTDNNFLKSDFHRTVLYTVTGNQYHEKCHVTGSANRTAFHRLVRLLRPGQRTLPAVGFAREIC